MSTALGTVLRSNPPTTVPATEPSAIAIYEGPVDGEGGAVGAAGAVNRRR